MSRESVESLQTHALPVQAQSFAVGDHASHYHAVDALSSNVLPAQRERVSPSDAQHKAPSTKRRKINTCFPCKQRKVKCDRQHPYCGQCQKHRIPAERCVWSSDVGVADMHASLEFTKPDTHASIGLAGEWSAQGAELGLDNDARAVIERISHLEQRLSSATPSQPAHDIAGTSTGQAQIDPLLLAGTTLSLGDVNAERQGAALPQDTTVAAELAFWRSKMEQHQRPSHGDSAQMAQMQAEQNIAADALAMFARHNQHTALSSDQALGRVGSTSDTRAGLLGTVFDSAFAIAGSSPATVRMRSALELLPTNQQIDYLLKTLQTVDLHLFCGVSWRLVRMQLATLRQQLAGWNRIHTSVPEHIDGSFLALLLALLGIAAHYVESRFFIEQGLCTSTDQIGSYVESWIDAAQSMLALDDFVNKTNWNHLAALYYVLEHQGARGRTTACASMLAMLLRLAELQGYHRLGSAKDDEEHWRESLASKQVRVSSVAAFRSAIGSTPSLPDRSHLVREAARRLWCKIASKSMLLGTMLPAAQSIDPERVTTRPPLNVDEEDLPDGETHVLPQIKEDGRATMNNLAPPVYAFADIARQWSDANARGTPSYNDVLSFDGKYRALLADLPSYLRPDPALEQMPEVRQEQAHRPYLAMQRLVIFEMVNHGLFMLHRCYLCLGQRDEKYAFSARAALDAARTIVSCRQQIDNVHPAVQRHWVFSHHLFQAAIVLALQLLEFSGKGQGGSQVAQQLREDIGLITNYLLEANSPANGSLSANAPQGRKVAFKLLELMLAEEADRRQRSDGDKSDSRSKVTDSAFSGSGVSSISMDGSNDNIFQLTNAASSDPVAESAATFMQQLLDPQFATAEACAEFFASLDELTAPIY
ncbi:hypothetical protein MCUN1_003667 [Malassezia cuniculi]|uniref:Zn(2)-C6 fungal-type domain-containing protein n=1 Tax=Malassezia cuniculi TaxID=948313 RepID=A0AAF0J866_9BASI|nr:hypothetical protein MCUN1_003667 [Malassezia cuniculi]